MAVPIIAGAAAGKSTETAATASMQTCNMGVQAAASGATSGGGISNTPLGGSRGEALCAGSKTGDSCIKGSPLSGAHSGTNKDLTGTGTIKKSSSLHDKMKEFRNKSNIANGMRKDIHGFGKDMMGQDAHRNDPERIEPRIHNRHRL